MKTCLAVGDLFVRCQDMAAGLASLQEHGYQVRTAEFDVGDYDALQGSCRKIELEGPASVPLPGDLERQMRDAEILVVHFCPVSGAVIRGHRCLELIGTCRTGTSNIDLEAAKSAGVEVVNCRGRLADAVADFTVGMMICEARNIARGHLALRQGQWRRRYHNLGNIPDLPGRTVGLVGFGSIGRAVARRLRGFGMTVLAHDPCADSAAAEALGVKMVTLSELLAASDFVSVHVDLRPATRHLIGAKELARMKPTAYLIDTARGGVVDEQALLRALREGRIAGAALDVYETEPLPADSELRTLDNVTLTPHMAGGSDDAFRRSPRVLCGLLVEALGRRGPRR